MLSATSYVALDARLVVGLVLVVSGLSKLSDRDQTRRGFADYGLRPQLSNVATWIVPATELAAGLSMLFGLLVNLSSTVAAALLTIFAALALRGLLFGGPAECHCFGNWLRERVGWHTVVRNLVLVLLACVSALTPSPILTMDAVIAGHRGYQIGSIPELLPASLIAIAILIAYGQLIRALGLELDVSTALPAQREEVRQ